MRCLIFFLTVFIVGCSTSKEIFERKELVSWEIRPRPGYKGLTSLRCLKWQEGKCIERDVVDFDLTVKEQRLRLHEARFVCRVGDGPHYRICKELDGLCQQTVVRKNWFKKEIKLISFLHIKEKYQYLIDKGTYCLSLDNELSRDLDF
jgi:hypothetical protein